MADLAGEVLAELGVVDAAGYTPANPLYNAEELVNIVIGDETLRVVLLRAISAQTQGWLARILPQLLFDILAKQNVDMDRTFVIFLAED